MNRVLALALMSLLPIACHAETAAPDKPEPIVLAQAGGAPYTVNSDGKVDKNTRLGFETWRAGNCAQCHGANQEGLVGPALIESLKTMSKDDFKTTVIKGRPEKGMPARPDLEPKLDAVYAYLKCRSDGACKTAKVEAAQ